MQLLDAHSVAAHLGISLRSIENLLARGDIPAPIRLGRLRRWRPEDLDAWLAAQATAAQEPEDAPRPRGRPRSQ